MQAHSNTYIVLHVWAELLHSFPKTLKFSFFLFRSFQPHKPMSIDMHACFVSSNGVPLDAAELDDCVYLFSGAAPRLKSALMCLSFFDSSAAVGCTDGSPDYSTDTAYSSKKKAHYWSSIQFWDLSFVN